MALQAAQVSCEVAGRTLTIETGKLAEQAGGAVTVRYGDTLILVTATASKEPRQGTDFFPLTVDYEQRHYASGKIPGGYPRREGRPSDDVILMCRLTDRPLRPLFPKGYRNDVQIIVYVLSADLENPPDTMGIIGASTALMISDIPFAGPIAAVRMGLHRRQGRRQPPHDRSGQAEQAGPRRGRHGRRHHDGRGRGKRSLRGGHPGSA